MRTRLIVPLLAGMAVLLSGCSTSGGAAGPTTIGYQSLAALRSAYTAAGSRCPVWSENDDIQAAAQSGSCGNGVTLSTYLNAADLLGEVKLLRDTASSGEDPGSAPRAELLIGPNWLVSGPHVRHLQPKLGGQLLVVNPAASR
jgi:hypothetical protein